VIGGAAETVAVYLKEHHTDGAGLAEAVRLAVAALGHSDAGDRVIPVDDLEVAVLDRSRTQPRKFKRILARELGGLLGDRGPTEHAPPAPADTDPGPASADPSADDPADPTDQVSGPVAPLEDPTSGEPPIAPPIAPPSE
jgi:proteasome alpha subunit